MNYNLAKQLKDAGFPQKTQWKYVRGYSRSENFETGAKEVNVSDWRLRLNEVVLTTGQEVFEWWYAEVKAIEADWVAAPTLEELIEDCGDKYFELGRVISEGGYWLASKDGKHGRGTTPTEAVAMLWLALQSKDTTK